MVICTWPRRFVIKWTRSSVTWGPLYFVGDLSALRVQISPDWELEVDNNFEPYLYRVVGSWGFSPAPGPWAAFLAWQRARALAGYEPDDLTFRGKLICTSYWWKQFRSEGREPSMWTAWYIRFMAERGLYCLYPNLPDKHGFARTFREPGEHDVGNLAGLPNSPLQGNWTLHCSRAPRAVVRIDFDGSLVRPLCGPPDADQRFPVAASDLGPDAGVDLEALEAICGWPAGQQARDRALTGQEIDDPVRALQAAAAKAGRTVEESLRYLLTDATDRCFECMSSPEAAAQEEGTVLLSDSQGLRWDPDGLRVGRNSTFLSLLQVVQALDGKGVFGGRPVNDRIAVTVGAGAGNVGRVDPVHALFQAGYGGVSVQANQEPLPPTLDRLGIQAFALRIMPHNIVQTIRNATSHGKAVTEIDVLMVGVDGWDCPVIEAVILLALASP
mmetsp:Transcript_80204/g.214845  ORF Transcript_80204/g.214845 Transcript_80204/m.214845 type:complete len:442 (+) Transcript_80204:231-1556(+)